MTCVLAVLGLSLLKREETFLPTPGMQMLSKLRHLALVVSWSMQCSHDVTVSKHCKNKTIFEERRRRIAAEWNCRASDLRSSEQGENTGPCVSGVSPSEASSDPQSGHRELNGVRIASGKTISTKLATIWRNSHVHADGTKVTEM